MKREIFLGVLVVSTITGCVSTSEVSEIGRNTYMVGTTARGGLQSRAEIAGLSAKKASEFCAQKNQKMVLSHTDTSGVQGWTPVETDITFHCFDENDPQYKAVELRKDAGTLQITP